MQDLIDLQSLSKLLDVPKNRLNFYAGLGLIRPIHVAGKAFVFDKKETLKIFSQIQKLKKRKLTLAEIHDQLWRDK